MREQIDVAIVGGGAAGIFAALQVKAQMPEWRVKVYEKSTTLLGKVKISGGGRCNVTHFCFVPRELVKFYPRGNKELMGPFTAFGPGEMYDWLEKRGVQLKNEEDGRVFPTTDSSQTIIDCFLSEADKLGVDIELQKGVTSIKNWPEGIEVQFADGSNAKPKALVIAGGSSKQLWQVIEHLGHTIVPPVPSLFTFNIKDNLLADLQGVATQLSEVKIVGTKFKEAGPVLVTHWGLSGPGILKLSAWAARELAEKDYHFTIEINWEAISTEQALEELNEQKLHASRKLVSKHNPFEIPNRLWEALVAKVLPQPKNYADLSKKEMLALAEQLTRCSLQVSGKSTYKDEFVTAGGVDKREIDFKTMESKLVPNLYFAGEVIDIDAVTGGFNFQAAWTTAFLAAKGILGGRK